MKILKKIIIGMMLLSAATFGTSSIAFAADSITNNTNEACKALELTGAGANCDEGESGVKKILRVVLNLVSILAGVMAVLMLIIAGIKYITSNGDSGSIKSAKDTIIYALVGVLVVIFAQAIVAFVLKKAIDTSSNSSSGNNSNVTNPTGGAPRVCPGVSPNQC